MNPSTAATKADPQRRRRRGSEELRVRLLEAALAEFAEHGYDGASTRAIAGRAGAHQPQINYHFHSKLELWRAAVDYLMDRLDEALAGIDGTDAREAMAGVIRGLVLFAAEWPELNRIMIQEGTAESERLTWIVDRHVRHRHAPLFDQLGPQAHQARVAVANMAVDDPGEALGLSRAFLDHDSIQLGPLGGEEHEASDHAGHGLARVGPVDPRHGFVETVHQVVHRGPPHLHLGVEVVVDLRLVGTGPAGDRPGGRAVVAVLGKFGQRGFEQADAQLLGAPPAGPVPTNLR